MNKNKIEIAAVDVNGRRAPMGIDDPRPLFHYLARSSGTDKRVTARQTQVFQGEKLVWDSGRTAGDGTPYVAYGGPALLPKTGYQVRIRVWDEGDDPSDFSPAEPFETGFLGGAWQGRWIEPEQEPAIREQDIGFFGMLRPDESFYNGQTRLREAQELEKRFVLAQRPVRARLYATAHGVYELTLNGGAVSRRRLAPETTRYDKLLYYQTYDVTDRLCAGENTLTVLLGDGWWIGRLGMAGDSCNYGDRLGFLMQLELEFADGSRRVIPSDESFQGRGSRIRYSDLYIGERQDDTYVPGPWRPCALAEYDNAVLQGQPTDPITVTGELPLREMVRTPAGELVLDFGQVLSGVIRLTLSAPAGTTVVLDHGEVLDRDGNFKSNIQGRNKNQQDVLVCTGGRRVFEPKFTYHGFRYVRVSGLAEEQILDAAALVIATPLSRTGTFETDDPRLNQLQHCIEWSAATNMTGVPTDCPQREKLGWTGDIQIFAPTGTFLMDLRNFLDSWLAQVRLDQYPDGQIPVVVPDHPSQERLQLGMSGSNSSSVWSDCCVLTPLDLYRRYGDRRVLEDNFSAMKKWMGYIAAVCREKPEGYEDFSPEKKARTPYLWTGGYHFGDWLIPSLRERPDGVMLGVNSTAAVVGACAYAIVTEGFIQVCRILKEDALADEYTRLLARIRAAVREEFVAGDGTVAGGGLQGLYVMVLRAGACRGELKEKVLQKLLDLLQDNGWRLDTGFSSVAHLLDTLYENGRRQEAYRLLYQTEAPSWLYMVTMGATTIWENWNAVRPDGTVTDSSYNHYAFGCVGEWMYRRMGGLYPAAPGCRAVRVEPDFACGLKWCRCAYLSPYGEVSCSWRLTGDGAEVSVTVPVDGEAELILGRETRRVGSGTHCYTVTL